MVYGGALDELSDWTTAAMSLSGSPDLITIPTLHLHGTKDANYANGKKQLATFYDWKTSRLLEIDYHHAMPWFRADLLKLIGGIENIYEDTQDWMWLVNGYSWQDTYGYSDASLLKVPSYFGILSGFAWGTVLGIETELVEGSFNGSFMHISNLWCCKCKWLSI